MIRIICCSWYYIHEGNPDHVLWQISASETQILSKKIEWVSLLPEKTGETVVYQPEFKVYKLN
jgi:hypothetical protein